MIQSHSMLRKDFSTDWYKKWAKALKQNKNHLDNHDLLANKFWQNAIIAQALWERGVITKDKRGLGFGVGQERLPALFASFGAEVTATDQDFKTKKAGYWAEHELATSTQSLNRVGICDKKIFDQKVDYMPANMTKIPAKLSGKYDFLWSNCALGHLGSIPAGLGFIEQSLNCLAPGGWAVHTTELNILSNGKTVEGGSTVIFRLKDLYALQNKLLREGYTCSTFELTLGDSPEDQRIAMRPLFGNDYSKIQVMGHLATQIVLLIHKPVTKLSPTKWAALAFRFKRAYAKNLITMRRYRATDQTIKKVLNSQKASVGSVKLKPKKSVITVKIPKGKTKDVYIDYSNQSDIPLFSLFARLGDCKPLVMATEEPRDRKSLFSDVSWQGADKNRPGHRLWVRQPGGYEEADYILPGQAFSFLVTFNANKLDKGSYTEKLAVVQEELGWVKDSTVELAITIA
jgi:hypothetical protein